MGRSRDILDVELGVPPLRPTGRRISCRRRRCTCRHRTRTVSRGTDPGVDDALGADRRPLRPVGRGKDGGTSTPNCHRIWFFAPTPGTGTARSPRRAPRRPPRARPRTDRSRRASARSRPSSSASLSSRSSAWSQVGKARVGLELLQCVERVAADPQPAAVREVQIHHAAPHWRPGAGTTPRSSTQPARPRSPDRPLVNTVPQKSSRSGISPSAECMEVLGRRDLEVVGALHRQVELGRSGEAGDRRRHVGPEERPQRVAPPRGLAEQLVEALLLVGVVAPALRLDADLAAQGQGVDGRAGRSPRCAAKHDASAPRRAARAGRRATSKARAHGSVTRRRHAGLRSDPVEERVESVVGLAAAVEAAPQRAAGGRPARSRRRSGR